MTEEEITDSEDLDEEEDALDETPEEGENPVVRQSDLAELQKTLKDFTAMAGRVQSIEARLNKAEDPSTRAQLERSLRAELAETQELTATILDGIDETSIDPAVKARIKDKLATARTKAERDAFRAEIVQELRGAEQPETTDFRASPAIQVWERTRTREITRAGLDPDSPALDQMWGEVSRFLAAGDFAGADRVADAAIDNAIKEDREARRRQRTKTNAGEGSPKGTGANFDPLDPSRPHKERAAYLKSIGVTVG